jgi:iron(III) transport system substrate-binding protein
VPTPSAGSDNKSFAGVAGLLPPLLGGLLLAVVALAGGYLILPGSFPGSPSNSSAGSLVVYCAHDELYADPILREFEKRTGIALSIKYDTEATKSLGLVNLIIQEEQRPACDVFWNNDVLGTMELAERRLLVPYLGTGFERIPSRFKDPQGRWAGFAARLRVMIVNTGALAADEAAIAARLENDPDLSRATIAKPMFGTTLTHYAALWHVWGEARLRAWHADLRARGIREVAGNALTKDLVAGGACDFGFTDTDDYFVARDEGKPVGLVPARVDGKTICIPNSVALVRSMQLANAQKLVDYLLSAETELALARSASRQIPLGPVAENDLPEEVRELSRFAKEGLDLAPLRAARFDVLRWLEAEYLR